MSDRHEGYEDYEYTLHKFLSEKKHKRYHCDCFIKYLKDKATNTDDQDVKEECDRRIRHIQKSGNSIRNSDIAFILGKDTSTVDRWVNCSFETAPDKIKYVDVRAVPIIAEAFGLSIEELLLDEPSFDIGKYNEQTLLKEAGINISLLLNFYNKQTGSDEGFDNVVKALYNLLSQRNSPFAILKAIGAYFESSNSYMKLAINFIDSFKMKSELESLYKTCGSTNSDNIKEQIDQILKKYASNIYNEANSHLDAVVSALKEKQNE